MKRSLVFLLIPVLCLILMTWGIAAAPDNNYSEVAEQFAAFTNDAEEQPLQETSDQSFSQGAASFEKDSSSEISNFRAKMAEFAAANTAADEPDVPMD